jgi:outer membrane protein OmpA-like peptidoglycan-associated protein
VKNSSRLIPLFVAAVLGGGVMVGCASAPKEIPELTQARLDVQTLQQDPKSQTAAQQELSNARKSLDAAEQALKKHDKDGVLHYSFLASQQAKAGEELAAQSRSQEQVAQGENDRNRVLIEARTREAQNATDQAKLATSEAKQQQAQAEAAKQEALTAQAQAEQARTETADVQRQLAELQAKQTDRGMVLTLGDVLFDTAQATLKPGATSVLERVASFMQKNEGTKVLIEGHTDSRGSDEYNEQLSQRRAQAVADALAFRGIDRGRVQAVGRGEALPVASNDDAGGRQQNRRVEIVFSDEAGRFASGSSASLR